jgi:fucose 4-O-acetylase-like acetyltransferase
LLVYLCLLFISISLLKRPELLSRLPIFDILITLFFGGLVGAIAITRVEKGNPIPGVAIATALIFYGMAALGGSEILFWAQCICTR